MLALLCSQRHERASLFSGYFRWKVQFGSSFQVEEKETDRFAHSTRVRAIATACCFSAHCLI
eukprot:3791868-Alexandrium_andersonii.AAC.1